MVRQKSVTGQNVCRCLVLWSAWQDWIENFPSLQLFLLFPFFSWSVSFFHPSSFPTLSSSIVISLSLNSWSQDSYSSYVPFCFCLLVHSLWFLLRKRAEDVSLPWGSSDHVLVKLGTKNKGFHAHRHTCTNTLQALTSEEHVERHTHIYVDTVRWLRFKSDARESLYRTGKLLSLLFKSSSRYFCFTS